MTTALPAERTEPATGIDLVLFAAGGFTFAMESTQVRALTAAEDGQAVELAALLGLSSAATGTRTRQRRLLWLLHPAGDQAVQVDEPVVHCHLTAAALYPLPPLLAARLTLPCVRALACLAGPTGESLAVVLDSTRLPAPWRSDSIRQVYTSGHFGRGRG